MTSQTETNNDYETLLLNFLKVCNISCTEITELCGFQILRETLLNNETYIVAKNYIPEFKKKFSSSYLTSLQSGAQESQKWPLINLLRQILKSYNYNLTPKRLANGYTKTGKKLYKRIFLVNKINPPPQ